VSPIHGALLLLDSGAELQQLLGNGLVGLSEDVDQLPSPGLVLTGTEECVGDACGTKMWWVLTDGMG